MNSCGELCLVSRASAASALARAERDPGPSARLAKRNISARRVAPGSRLSRARARSSGTRELFRRSSGTREGAARANLVSRAEWSERSERNETRDPAQESRSAIFSARRVALGPGSRAHSASKTRVNALLARSAGTREGAARANLVSRAKWSERSGRNETRDPAQESRSAVFSARRVAPGSRVFAPASPSLARDTRAVPLSSILSTR
jgi:hypothetical protein